MSAENVIGHKFKIGQIVYFRPKSGSQSFAPSETFLDHDTIALTKLKEEMRLRQRRHAAGPRPANEVMTPHIKMIVSNWYTDELGNQARFIKARD